MVHDDVAVARNARILPFSVASHSPNEKIAIATYDLWITVFLTYGQELLEDRLGERPFDISFRLKVVIIGESAMFAIRITTTQKLSAHDYDSDYGDSSESDFGCGCMRCDCNMQEYLWEYCNPACAIDCDHDVAQQFNLVVPPSSFNSVAPIDPFAESMLILNGS
jgi:hypothetical protein